MNVEGDVGAQRRVSLSEVARASGVSPATASRVLNPDNLHPVRDEIRARVLDAAEELNYTVNALARGVKVGRTRNIGVIVHDVRDSFFGQMAAGVSSAAGDAGYLTLLCNSDRDPDTELRYLQFAVEQRVAGVLFVGGGFRSRRYQASLRRQLEGLRTYGGHAVALGSRGGRIPTEVADDKGGGRQGTEHLLGLGHERIAYIDGPAEIVTSQRRRSGYEAAIEGAGLTLDQELVVRGDFTREGGRRATRELIERGVHFTAVFAADDEMAVGCLAELSSRGVSIPQTVSLVGFDDLPDVRWFDPSLTTVSIPISAIADAGITRLVALLDSDAESATGSLINVHPTELIVRESTAPPRRRKALR